MLSVVIKHIMSSYFNNGQPYVGLLFSTIFLTMFFGLLRITEIADGPHVVKARDVHIGENKRKMLLILHSSKMHGPGMHPQMIKISAKTIIEHNKDRKLACPFELLQQYASVRGKYKHDSDKFFVLSDGEPVPATHIQKCLKNAIKESGFDHRFYGSHGLRAGRSCDLYQLGLSVETIKKLGRWKSNVVYRYLRC